MKKSFITAFLIVAVGFFAFGPILASTVSADDSYQPEGQYCDKAVSFLFYTGPVSSLDALSVAVDWALNYVSAYHCSI